jgi:hypothetical protein
MNRSRARCLGGLLLVCAALATALAGGSAAQAVSGRTAAVSWKIVPAPGAGQASELFAVSADSPSDVWAVGNFFADSRYRTLAERWDGAKWSVVPTPNPRMFNWLNGVAALSPTNVWAVGFSNNSWWGENKTLIEHWNGTRWSIVPSPSPSSTGQNDLWSVSAVSPTDIWAVGETNNSSGGATTLVEHWNGTRWSVVPSPSPSPTYSLLHSVAAIAANDVWAAGNAYDDATDEFRTLIEHWNGTRWSVVPSPSMADDDYVRSVYARASNDVWLVGVALDPAPSYAEHPLVEHWNGSKWSIVSTPQGETSLYDVVALSATDAWIVGDADYGARTLAERWNGTSWNFVSTPNTASSLNALNSVAAIGTTLWAVGSDGSHPLILRATGA